MKNDKTNDFRIFIWCSVLLFVSFIADCMFRWTAGGMLYVFVVMLSLGMTKDKDTYFFAVLTTLLLITSWRFAPSTVKIWHVSIGIIWVTAISGLRFKKVQIIKSSLAAIVDSSFDAIVGMSFDNVVLSWNAAAENLFGYTREQMLGRSAGLLLPEDNREDELRLLDQVRAGERIKHYQITRRHRDGHLIPVSLSLSPIKDPFGNIVGISSVARDISERIKAEGKLRKLNDAVALERNKIRRVLNIEEHLNTIFDTNKLIDFIVHKTMKVLDAKRCSLILVDYETRELCLKGHEGIEGRFIQKEELERDDSVSRIIVNGGKPVLVQDIESDKRFLRKKRESYESGSFISAPIKLGGNILGLINVSEKRSKEGNIFSDLDLSILCMIVRQVAVAMENARLYRDLKHLTLTDPLTHINNFRHFTKTLDHEIARLNRHPQRPLCLLMIDVDNFKAYNDDFGHLAGDTLLQKLSRVFKESVREVDVVCRYAGDEFAVILPETAGPEARMVAERIIKATGLLSLQRKITVSIGVSKCTTHNTNRYELIQSADVALSHAKKTGKNLVHSHG